MAKIALIAMSAKPFHKGHMYLITLAARENDLVKVFVSTSDRVKKGEVPIYGKDMQYVWIRFIEDLLPTNVEVQYGGSPITRVWEVLQDANQSGTTDVFSIYSDPSDLQARFSPQLLKKYALELYEAGSVVLKPVDRVETSNVSGTVMRKALQDDDYGAFNVGMPRGLDVKSVWNLLRSSAKLTSKEDLEVQESFLRRYVRSLLVESKVDDLKKKYPNVDVDLYADNDPSRNNKYLEWMVKQAAKGHSQEDIIATVSYFHINVVRFKSKDINAYKDLKDLEDEVKEVSQTKSKTQQKKEIKASGSDDIYEDDEVIVKHIKEKDACQVYGAGTKWCITMSNTSYWEQYVGANVVFYYMLRKQPLNDDFDKVAFAVQRDGKNNVKKIEYYNTRDDNVNEQTLSSHFKRLSKILNLVSGHASNVEKGLIAKIVNNEATKEEIQKAFDLYEDDPKTLEYLLDRVKLHMISVKTLKKLTSNENLQIRVKIAQNRITPLETLIMLASDKDWYVRANVAENVSTPLKTLIILASDEHWEVRKQVAKNVSTPLEISIQLASDEHWEVRKQVAKNVSTPLEILIQLASDEHWEVRKQVAIIDKLPATVLAKLATDKDVKVLIFVAKNPSTPPEALAQLAFVKNVFVRSSVALNSSTPSETLIKLASDKERIVRYNVLDNPSISIEALKKLSNTPGLHAKAINAIVKRQEAR